MRFRELDVPQEVIDAAVEEKLVIFVGAGASRDLPSGLPDFRNLAKSIGAKVGRVPTPRDLEQLDVFLGRVNDLKVDVHGLVAEEIGREGSAPNRLHRALVSLAAAYRVPKIVTTNYDLHLEAAAHGVGLDLPVFDAPALPLGDDFQGIVHLHGALNQENRRLVVTDSDFGEAYLRDAWAARFLERMFTKFVVLFVGYRHGDLVMQYLARSLGPTETRFILTSDGDSPEWSRLGLRVIPYEAPDGDHSAVPAAIERWVEYASLGQTEHRRRIAEMVSAEPPTIPEDIAYLEVALNHPVRIRYFCEHARFSEVGQAQRWLDWVSMRDPFGQLFGRESTGSAPSSQLISWIADEYLVDGGKCAVALRALRGGAWSPEAWATITRRLAEVLEVEAPSWATPWVMLAMQNAPTLKSELLDLLLPGAVWKDNVDLALLVLENRTRPFAVSAFDLTGHSVMPSFEAAIPGEDSWLSESWAKCFRPLLPEHGSAILGLVEQQLVRLCRTTRVLSTNSGFDRISFGRMAIEPHPQDRYRHDEDFLIDAVRDSIESVLSSDPAEADRHLGEWQMGPDAILRRLAVHAWRVRSDKTASEKVCWLRERGWLWSTSLHHEVFQLVRECFQGAGEPERRWVLESAIAGPLIGEDPELDAYRSYNLLAWLADANSGVPEVVQAWDAARARHPDWQAREQPDLGRTMSFGFVENAMPFSVNELHALVTEDPASALDDIRSYEQQARAFSGPTWEGALRAVAACVGAYPEDGLALASVLGATDNDVRSHIIRGWSRSEVGPGLLERVIGTISQWPEDEVRADASEMLSDGGEVEHPTRWQTSVEARSLAAQLWPKEPIEGRVASEDDLLMEAINHPAGKLAEFWTKAVQADWSSSGDSWAGMPIDLREPLDLMVNAKGRNGLLARSLLCSQLHFFLAADPEWARDRLLPLLDWDGNEVEARGAWLGFLTWGRPSQALVGEGLDAGYVETARRAGSLPTELRVQLASHIAGVVLFDPSDPLSMLKLLVAEAPTDWMVIWAREIEHALRDLDPEESTRQWERWIRSYWSGRNQSVPRPFGAGEASATAVWVTGLSSVLGGAVDVACQSGASLDGAVGLLYRLDQDNVELAANAKEWVRFLTQVLHNTTGQWVGAGHHLRNIVVALRSADPQPDLEPLIEEAMRLGMTDAPSW